MCFHGDQAHIVIEFRRVGETLDLLEQCLQKLLFRQPQMFADRSDQSIFTELLLLVIIDLIKAICE
jgi:hypothetical protein